MELIGDDLRKIFFSSKDAEDFSQQLLYKGTYNVQKLNSLVINCLREAFSMLKY
jgi:hypothetical protein